MFSIQTNSGKDIRAHSYFENEDEILLPPGLYFKVIGSLNPAEGLHIIQLREIPPPYPMLAEPFDLSQLKEALPGSKPSSHVSKPPNNARKILNKCYTKADCKNIFEKRQVHYIFLNMRTSSLDLSAKYISQYYCMSSHEVLSALSST